MLDEDMIDVDVRAWVEAANTDPELYRARQVTEIALATIGASAKLSRILVLKGGALMALAFESVRLTRDVDFTAEAEPDGFADALRHELDRDMPRVAMRLGYLELALKIQSIKMKPRKDRFEEHDFPALLVKVASARQGPEQKRLEAGHATRTVSIEISFRDPVFSSQILQLNDGPARVRAFTLEELIGEKLRALLQQPIRNRYRRQDVYDIAYLLEFHAMSPEARAHVIKILRLKCGSRGIVPTIESIDDPEVIRRARDDWGSLQLEISDLPPFEDRFARVADFYRSLPWHARA
jgi:predicted nucleotidyltransferase component of viral defense system